MEHINRKNKKNISILGFACSIIAILFSIIYIVISIDAEQNPVFGIVLLVISVLLFVYNLKQSSKKNVRIKNSNVDLNSNPNINRIEQMKKINDSINKMKGAYYHEEH